MPTFYEGEPIAVVKGKLSQEDYAKASYQAKCYSFPMCRRWVRCAICITGALVFAALIPSFEIWFSNWWIPGGGVVFCVAMALFFFMVQPKYDLEMGADVFRSNQLFAEETSATMYRDSVIIENQYEKILEYWTDFHACLESKDYILVLGGRERELLVFVKASLEPDALDKLVRHLENAFASRYRHIR